MVAVRGESPGRCGYGPHGSEPVASAALGEHLAGDRGGGARGAGGGLAAARGPCGTGSGCAGATVGGRGAARFRVGSRSAGSATGTAAGWRDEGAGRAARVAARRSAAVLGRTVRSEVGAGRPGG